MKRLGRIAWFMNPQEKYSNYRNRADALFYKYRD